MMDWCSQLIPSVPGIASGSKATLISMKQGLKATELQDMTAEKAVLFHINPEECALS